jgi:hypothetical protein
MVQKMSGVASRFDNQGQSIASALEQANSRIDNTLQRLSGKATQLDEFMRGYSATMEGTLADAEARARQLINQFAQGTAAHAQAAVRELERLRLQGDGHSKAVVSAFDRIRAQEDAQTQAVPAEFERVRSDAERLPIATRESADAMRSALNDQLRALEQLSSLAGRREAGPTLSLPAGHAHPAMPPPPPPMPSAGDGAERWSLGDLLARASRDDDGTPRTPMLDLEGIARALDPTTASAIWSRFRAGQRGIMVRSIYSAEGRSSFDEVTERYGKDMEFRRTVDRFLADFEGLVRETEQKSPRAVHDHLVSDAGRVYLFLAHASGRLR